MDNLSASWGPTINTVRSEEVVQCSHVALPDDCRLLVDTAYWFVYSLMAPAARRLSTTLAWRMGLQPTERRRQLRVKTLA